MSETAIERIKETRERIQANVERIIVGQEKVLEEVMIALLAGGHALLVGVPGLAKTRLIRAVAAALGLKFRRIQFTPDLMPSDITGTEVLEEEVGTGRRVAKFVAGPVFTNVLLADEINRTPPRTQAALLEAMQEKQVTVGNETRKLDDPFFVLATQNPIEQEGTYPLPEAQLDRFMLQIRVPYPTRLEEEKVALLDPVNDPELPEVAIRPEELRESREHVRSIVVADSISQYAVALVRATRPREPECPESLRSLISWGAGPRAGQYLILASRVRAALAGRIHVSVSDIHSVAPSVLRHRILPSYTAEADGVTSDDLITRLVAALPVST